MIPERSFARPIKVVHLITELNMGGAEQMLLKLVTRMDREKFRCIVVSMTGRGPIGEKIAAAGIPVLPLGMKLGKPTLAGTARFFHFLKQESIDIIQTWLYHADLFGLLVGRPAGVPRVVWGIRCSDMRLRKYRPLTALTVRLCGYLSSLVDAIVVNSLEGKRIHRKRGYHTERMILIPNGFDMERFRPDRTAKAWLAGELGVRDVPLIGLAARFDPMKDQRTFLRAAALLAEKDAAPHFVMIGRGMVADNAQLMPFVHPGLKGRIHLLGLRDDMSRIMAALDVASSSSAFGEGFSNTIGEAMACGVPCVVTDVGDSRQIVGDTGFVVPPEDPAALARAWGEILGMDKEKKEALGQRARARIAEHFELGQIARRFEEFYGTLYKDRES